MENDYLGRNDAPLTGTTWDVLEKTMVEAAKSQLSGRRLLPIEGPLGFAQKVIALADIQAEGCTYASNVIPLNVLTSSFRLGKRDIAAFERDGVFLDSGPVASAAMECAKKEDELVFRGIGNMPGLTNADGTGSLTLAKWEKVGAAADQIIEAVTRLDEAGFHGPYTMALAPAQYNLLLRRYPQGEGTELDHAKAIVTDGIVKAPVLKKGGILLASGRQYCSLAIGLDMSIGFNGPAGEYLDFTVSESAALLIRVPEAVCVLK